MHTSPPYNPQMRFEKEWVIYADQDILVVNKPSGLLSVPGRGPDKQECLLSHVLPHYPQASIVHRLDMDTSGLMVLAQNQAAHRHLSHQFQERLTTKTYHALCQGMPSQTKGFIGLPMRCDWVNRPLQMVDFLHGKKALTYWQIEQQFKDCFLVELTPITGRSHQLRVHMQALGHPILGDNLYADSFSLQASKRLMLHATNLALRHPKTEQRLQFNAPNPFKEYGT